MDPNSNSNPNTQAFAMRGEYFVGCLEAKDFAGTVVQAVLYCLQLCWRHCTQVRSLWDVATDETDDLFYRTFLPGAVGITEVHW